MLNVFKNILLLAIISLSSLSVAQNDSEIAYPDEDQYSLGASDVIEIIVFGEDDLTVERRVNSRGNISFPLLGAVNVQGQTVNEVAALLTAKLKGDYLVNPQLNVSMVEYRQFYVRGEVKKPGGFSYLPGLTIGKAIAMSGGFTERANRKAIKVSREQSGGNRNQLNLKIQDRLVPGDILIVEESFF